MWGRRHPWVVRCVALRWVGLVWLWLCFSVPAGEEWAIGIVGDEEVVMDGDGDGMYVLYGTVSGEDGVVLRG
jgi:hypothetical protein